MKLYLVQRFGVYDQGVFAICDSKDKARLALEDAKKKEPDDYHGFCIYEMELNKYVDIAPNSGVAYSPVKICIKDK